jgi:hypothetical protein
MPSRVKYAKRMQNSLHFGPIKIHDKVRFQWRSVVQRIGCIINYLPKIPPSDCCEIVFHENVTNWTYIDILMAIPITTMSSAAR